MCRCGAHCTDGCRRGAPRREPGLSGALGIHLSQSPAGLFQCPHTLTHTHTHTHTHTDTHRHRHTHTHTHRDTHRQTDRQKDRHTGRQADRQPSILLFSLRDTLLSLSVLRGAHIPTTNTQTGRQTVFDPFFLSERDSALSLSALCSQHTHTHTHAHTHTHTHTHT